MGRRLGWVFVALAATAVAEVVVFILVGRWIGFGWTVLLVLALSVAGTVLMRRESVEVWRRLREVLATGQPAGAQVIDGLVRVGGAFLLVIPGLLTGAVGAVLSVPPVRRMVRGLASRRAERRLSSATAGDLFGPRKVRVQHAQRDDPGPTIEGEIVGKDENAAP